MEFFKGQNVRMNEDNQHKQITPRSWKTIEKLNKRFTSQVYFE